MFDQSMVSIVPFCLAVVITAFSFASTSGLFMPSILFASRNDRWTYSLIDGDHSVFRG